MQAGFWIRIGALILDGVIIGIPLSIISSIVVGGGDAGDNFSNIMTFLYSLLVPVIWGGYTIGKRICGIRIRKVNDHEAPGIGTMLFRNLIAAIVYALTLGIGVIISAFMIGLREDRRAIHDFIAGTEVVHD